MSKLPKEHQFLDLSDYGRGAARFIANAIKETALTPIHVTIGFILSGFFAIYFILIGQYQIAAIFLILKSILDAADGELARIKNTPSYTGRYFDSVADIILNLMFLTAICYVTDGICWLTIIAFLGIQLQGTLYNFYYVILRNRHDGDKTSKIFEVEKPIAMKGEKQSTVNFFFYLYQMMYGIFDRTIYAIDKRAAESKNLPKWFMTMVSTFGLGFQLLIMAMMLVIGWREFIIPFFIIYSFFIFVFVGIRRTLN